MRQNETQFAAAISNRNQGGACALPVEVKIVTLANVALCAVACAVACVWKCYLPALGLGAACAVSVFMLTTFKIGGAE